MKVREGLYVTLAIAGLMFVICACFAFTCYLMHVERMESIRATGVNVSMDQYFAATICPNADESEIVVTYKKKAIRKF